MVLFAPRTQPVNVLLDIAAYVISSLSIFILPEAGNPEELLRTILSVFASIAPFKVSNPVANVTSPADVVDLIGVISL